MTDAVRHAAFAARMQWIEDVLASDLDAALKVLAVRIGLHKNDRTGQCDPSKAGLAAGINQSPRTVQRQRQQLRELGWISYDDNRGGRGRRTQHELTKPGHSSVSLSTPKPSRGSDTLLATEPGHSRVSLSGFTKGDTKAPKGRHPGPQRETRKPLKGDTALSPEPRTYKHRTLSAVAPAPLANGSRPLPQREAKEVKEVAAVISEEESKQVQAGFKDLAAQLKANASETGPSWSRGASQRRKTLVELTTELADEARELERKAGLHRK
jgi:hypothetical protein